MTGYSSEDIAGCIDAAGHESRKRARDERANSRSTDTNKRQKGQGNGDEASGGGGGTATSTGGFTEQWLELLDSARVWAERQEPSERRSLHSRLLSSAQITSRPQHVIMKSSAARGRSLERGTTSRLK